MLIISTGLRPKRSASRPKMKAPRGRNARVRVSAQATPEIGTLKLSATSASTKTRTKKSKASSDQARKAAITACRSRGVQPVRIAMQPLPFGSAFQVAGGLETPEMAGRNRQGFAISPGEARKPLKYFADLRCAGFFLS